MRACECLSSKNPLCYFNYDALELNIGKCLPRTDCEQAWNSVSCSEMNQNICFWNETNSRC